MDAPITVHWKRDLVRRKSRNETVPEKGLVLAQPGQNFNVEQGVSRLENRLDEISSLVHGLREIVVTQSESLASIRENVELGIEVTERSRERLSEQLRRVARELKQAIAENLPRVRENPALLVWFWWQFVWQCTVWCWQASFKVYTNVQSTIFQPVHCCLCAFGCMFMESAILLLISDAGLSAATCCVSHVFGVHYQLYFFVLDTIRYLLLSIGRNMINAAINYYRPYVEITAEVSGLSSISFSSWYQLVTDKVSDFISGAVNRRAQSTVTQVANSITSVTGSVYNNTIGQLPSAVDVSALGQAASGSISSGISAVTSKVGDLSASARRWTGLGGNLDSPFAHIHLLEGEELELFHKSKTGKYLKVLHKKLNKLFLNKYGMITVLDQHTEEIMFFMEKASVALIESIIPFIADTFLVSEIVEVEPGMRVALMKSAFGFGLKRKTLRLRKMKKRKTLRFR